MGKPTEQGDKILAWHLCPPGAPADDTCDKHEGMWTPPCARSPAGWALGSGDTLGTKWELLGGQKGLGVELLTLEVPRSLCKATESLKWS